MKSFSRLFFGLAMLAGLAMMGCSGEGDAAPEDKDTGGESKASAASDNHASMGDTGELMTVSLELPQMTWGGCEAQVREALTSAGIFSDIELDCTAKTGSISVANNVDVKAKLSEIAENTPKMKDWSIAN